MSSFFSSCTQNKNVINKETEALAAATAAAAEESEVCEFEQTLLSVSECFVYKVPTLRSASGHRAEDWSLAAPLFTGALRMYQSDLKMRIALFTYNDPKTVNMAPENLTLFGECFIEVKPGGDIMYFVDGVIDSSRYYVLRLQDRASTRSVLMGIGFRERDTAFDFKNALNDYVRYLDRMAAAEKAKAIRGTRGEGGDYSPGENTRGSIDRNDKNHLNNQRDPHDTNDKNDKNNHNDKHEKDKNNYQYERSSNDRNNVNDKSAAVVSLSQHRDLSIPTGQKITIKSKLLSLKHDPKSDSEIDYIRRPSIGCRSPESGGSTPDDPSSPSPSPLRKFLLAPPPQAKPCVDPISFDAAPAMFVTGNMGDIGNIGVNQGNGGDGRDGGSGSEEIKVEGDGEEWGDFGSASIVD